MKRGVRTRLRVKGDQRSAINRRLVKQGIDISNMPIGPVVDHINQLIAHGLTATAISALAGANEVYVAKLLLRDGGSMDRRIGMAILRITPRDVPDRGTLMVSAVGSHRRVRALAAAGWPFREIAVRLGVTPQAVSDIFNHEVVTVSRRNEIVDIYRELGHLQGPSPRTKAIAFRRGWPNPFDWETADIDDPGSFPVVVERVVGDRRGQALALVEAGMSRARVAKKLGVSLRTVERWACG